MLMPSIFGESLFDNLMDFSFPDVEKALYGNRVQNVMKTDIRETEGGYELDIDLPGFKKEEVKAQLEKGYLTVSAAKGQEREDADKEKRYLRRERYMGSASRSFYVGEGVTQNDIHARFEDGILKLFIPRADKQAVEQKKYISIEG